MRITGEATPMKRLQIAQPRWKRAAWPACTRGAYHQAPPLFNYLLNVQMKLKSIRSELLGYVRNNEDSEQNLDILDNNRWIPFNGEIRNSKPLDECQLVTPNVLKYLCTDHSDWFCNGSRPKPGPSRRHDSFRLGGRHRVLNSTWVDSLADNIK